MGYEPARAWIEDIMWTHNSTRDFLDMFPLRASESSLQSLAATRAAARQLAPFEPVLRGVRLATSAYDLRSRDPDPLELATANAWRRWPPTPFGSVYASGWAYWSRAAYVAVWCDAADRRCLLLFGDDAEMRALYPAEDAWLVFDLGFAATRPPAKVALADAISTLAAALCGPAAALCGPAAVAAALPLPVAEEVVPHLLGEMTLWDALFAVADHGRAYAADAGCRRV